MTVGSKHVRRRCTVVELSNVRLTESPFTGKQVKAVIFPAHLDFNCCYVFLENPDQRGNHGGAVQVGVSCGSWVCCAGGVSCGSRVVSASCGVPRGPNMDRK